MKAARKLTAGFLPAGLALALHAAPAAAETPPGAPAFEAGSDSVAIDPVAVPLSRAAPPAEYDLPPPSTRWNLLLTGVAVTGVSYGLAVGASYAWPSARQADELRIPIVGPWMAIADTACDPGVDCSTVLLIVTAILSGMDGVVQAGGVGVVLESLFLPTASEKPRRDASPSVRPVPYVAGKDGVGLGLVGTF